MKVFVDLKLFGIKEYEVIEFLNRNGRLAARIIFENKEKIIYDFSKSKEEALFKINRTKLAKLQTSKDSLLKKLEDAENDILKLSKTINDCKENNPEFFLLEDT